MRYHLYRADGCIGNSRRKINVSLLLFLGTEAQRTPGGKPKDHSRRG